jgi:hypothetical protein
MNPKVTYTDANANSLSDKILRWELLETKLEPFLDAMPHIKTVHAELHQLILDAKNLEFQVKGLKTGASKVAQDRRALVRTGDRLRSRLASALSFEHGSTSVELKEFGLRPRPAGRTRTKPDPVPVPMPEAQTAPSAGTSGTKKE